MEAQAREKEEAIKNAKQLASNKYFEFEDGLNFLKVPSVFYTSLTLI